MQKSEVNFEDNEYKHDQNSSQDFNQLACCLKNAIFSKYVSKYLIEKAEEMWNLYEKRIDKYLEDKHIDISCNHNRPQTAIKLEEFAKTQQEGLTICKRNIEILCSSRKRLQNDDKYSIQLQSTQHSVNNDNAIHVPKTPRCIGQLEFNVSAIKSKYFPV